MLIRLSVSYVVAALILVVGFSMPARADCVQSGFSCVPANITLTRPGVSPSVLLGALSQPLENAFSTADPCAGLVESMNSTDISALFSDTNIHFTGTTCSFYPGQDMWFASVAGNSVTVGIHRVALYTTNVTRMGVRIQDGFGASISVTLTFQPDHSLGVSSAVNSAAIGGGSCGGSGLVQYVSTICNWLYKNSALSAAVKQWMGRPPVGSMLFNMPLLSSINSFIKSSAQAGYPLATFHVDPSQGLEVQMLHAINTPMKVHFFATPTPRPQIIPGTGPSPAPTQRP